MAKLILVRHGESFWNLQNRFCGWVDVPLSPRGVKEALLTAKNLKEITFDIAFTSELERAQETLLLILSEQGKTGIHIHTQGKMKEWSENRHGFGKNEIPIHSDWRLNERYYGDLQGLNKNSARRKWGKKQVHLWRRSYDVPPPNGECLKDVYKRVVPYYKKNILPELKKGKDVIIAAHGNSLRALIKYLDGISDEEIPHLELKTGKPVFYKYSRGKVVHDSDAHEFTRPTHWKHT